MPWTLALWQLKLPVAPILGNWTMHGYFPVSNKSMHVDRTRSALETTE